MMDGLLATDVSRFLRYLGVERQLSPITLLNYQRQLDAIMQIADEIGLKSWQQCDAGRRAIGDREQGVAGQWHHGGRVRQHRHREPGGAWFGGDD